MATSFCNPFAPLAGDLRPVWRRRRPLSRAIARAQGGARAGDGDEDLIRGMSKNELDNLLGDDESKALLKDLSAAAQRVEAAKREMAELNSSTTSGARSQAQERFVEECEEDVIAAQAELKAAEIALIAARAGETRKWDEIEVDENVERMESGRAAMVSAMAGVLASFPIAFSTRVGIAGLATSEALVLASCAVFGVTYRYAVRRDVGNLQLKSGATAGFALVRVLGQLEILSPSWREWDYQILASLVGQSVVIFLTSALALDLCMRIEIIQPFPSRKRTM